MQKYILLFSDVNDGFRLVGPFPSDEELQFWGEHWDVENGDDPRWTVIDLPEFEGSVYALPVTTPERLTVTFLDDRIAGLKANLRGYEELRRTVRERERGHAEGERSPARSA